MCMSMYMYVYMLHHLFLFPGDCGSCTWSSISSHTVFGKLRNIPGERKISVDLADF